MKILRVTMFPPPPDSPITTVMRESDVKTTLEDAAKVQEEFPGGFVICDIFELPGEPTIEEATFRAIELCQAAAEREEHMALTYYYDAAALPTVMAGGILTMTSPSPLSVEDLKVPLLQLGNHPNYNGQSVIAISHDGKIVEYRDGKIEVTSVGA